MKKMNVLECSYCGKSFLTSPHKSPALCKKCEKEATRTIKKKNGIRKYAKNISNNCSAILDKMMGD